MPVSWFSRVQNRAASHSSKPAVTVATTLKDRPLSSASKAATRNDSLQDPTGNTADDSALKSGAGGVVVSTTAVVDNLYTSISAALSAAAKDEEWSPNMAYKSNHYAADSDADDEFERPDYVLPPLQQDRSPSESDGMTSPEHTPTTFGRSQSGESHASPTTLITDWTSAQCVDYLKSLSLGQYSNRILGWSMHSPERLNWTNRNIR